MVTSLMTTSHFYRALTINERKHRMDISNGAAPIPEAFLFWKDLMNVEDNDFDLFLSEAFDIERSFFGNHFELNEHVDFESDDKWFKNMIQLNFSKGDISLEERYSTFHTYLFFPFFKSFIKLFDEKFHKKTSSTIKEILTDQAYLSIIQQLLDMLLHISHKTLILEINTLSMEGKLQGETAEERYQYFYTLLDKDENYRGNLMKEYPVLFRLLITKVDYFLEFISIVLNHLIEDKEKIESKLLDQPIDHIINIKMGSGDSHQKGKSVTIIEFDKENKVIYKPRSLEIDEAFNNLVSWINESNQEIPTIKTVNVLNFGEHGWAEYIEFNECSTTIEVEDFYNRLGQQLAILHVLNATDFHYENIIAHGEYPVLIDLESLFHHALTADHSLTDSPVVNKALITLRDSVVSTGLIPAQKSNKISDEETEFDISGISDTEGQTIPFKVSMLTNRFSDEIRLEKQYGELKPGYNHPKVLGESIKVVDYFSHINSGFRSVYHFLIAEKGRLKDQIQRFGSVRTRKIFRNTMQYAKLLDLSYHPDFLRNQIDREILLFRLWKESGADKDIQRLSHFEVEDLLEGDIPYFYTTPKENRIWSSNRRVLNDFFHRNGLLLSLDKISSLNKDDCENQISMINSSIMGASEQDYHLVKFNDRNNLLNQNNILEKAEEIGDILLDIAISSEEDNFELCWISMVLQGVEETNWTYSVTGPGLYDGNSGISLLFAYLWKSTGKEKFKEAAYASLEPIKKLMKDLMEPNNVSIGAFLGITSPMYTMHHLAVIFQDDELLDECLHYIKDLDRYIANDRVLDIIGGSAGALMVVLNLYEHLKQDWLLEIARKLADHLINTAEKQTIGCSWPVNIEEKDSYIGFSHGVAGIIASLSRYYKYSHDERIMKVIGEALLYENSFYSTKENNWYSGHLEKYPIAWCHGSPGILLSRAIMQNNIGNKFDLEKDIVNAKGSIYNRSNPKNFSLCHGELGTLDILLKVKSLSSELNDIQLDTEINRAVENLFNNNNLLRADINSVGMMSGISGIAYGLLRIIDPVNVPSLTALDGPIKN